jgi:hypothetical protein
VLAYLHLSQLGLVLSVDPPHEPRQRSSVLNALAPAARPATRVIAAREHAQGYSAHAAARPSVLRVVGAHAGRGEAHEGADELLERVALVVLAAPPLGSVVL